MYKLICTNPKCKQPEVIPLLERNLIIEPDGEILLHKTLRCLNCHHELEVLDIEVINLNPPPSYFYPGGTRQ